MKIKVNPMVVAAALGLLGPAALADDEPEGGVAGQWARIGGGAGPGPATLGDRIEVIPVEDRVLLDDGTELDLPTGSWTQADETELFQELHIEGQNITRAFRADGNELRVHTVVDAGGTPVETVDHFRRLD